MKLLTTLLLGDRRADPRRPESAAANQQPDTIGVLIGSDADRPPRLAVPEFIPLGKEPEVLSAAKTIADVLWDDFAFEKEFYLLPRDILRTVPRPASVEQVSIDRWKELGADGVVIGTVQKTADGIVVEVRLMRVVNGAMALGKKYSGSLRSLTDGGRVYAHGIADEIHQTAAQSARRGADQARVFLRSGRPAHEGARRGSGYFEHLHVRLRWREPDAADGHALARHRARLGARRRHPRVHARTEAAIRTSSCSRSARSGRRTNPARGSIENHNFLPAWSPDGTKLAFMSNRDGNPEIYIVNRDGTNLRRITNHPNADVTPTWAPSGKQLAFTSDRTGLPQVYIVNVDGTGLDRISAESRCDRATWSPLNEIAYAAQAGGGYEIRLFSFGTRSSRVVTDGIGSNESPTVSPNGRHIAFMSDRTGKPQIYTIARDGTDLRQITRTGGNRYPNWSQ